MGGIRPDFTIGDRLRKARTMLGQNMDAGTFAEMIGTSRNTVTNYELERTAPERMKPIVLRQWALATGVDYDWLVGTENGAPTGGSLVTHRYRPLAALPAVTDDLAA